MWSPRRGNPRETLHRTRPRCVPSELKEFSSETYRVSASSIIRCAFGLERMGKNSRTLSIAAYLPRTKWVTGLVVLLLVCLSLGAGAWFARAPILQGAAQLWIVTDKPHCADAIVVLGGGLETRPFAAAKLYQQGYAPKVLVANVKPGPAERLGVVPSHTELNRQALLKLGVPLKAIITFGTDVSSFYEESLALRDWVRQNEAKDLLVPMDLFSARRARWLLSRVLSASGAQAAVIAADPAEYTRGDWWQHEEGLISFQNEVIKFGYYHVKYRVVLSHYGH